MIDLQNALPIQFLKGVGPILAKKFAEKNLHHIYDLIYFYPRAYRIKRKIDCIESLQSGQYVVVEGEIFSKNVQKRGYRSSYSLTLQTAKGQWFFIKYFKLPYKGFFNSFEMGQTVKIFGMTQFYRNQLEFHHPEFLSPNDTEEIIPIYSEIESVSQKKIRKLIALAFDKMDQEVIHWMPEKIQKEFQLPSHLDSLKDIHYPQKQEPEMYLNYQAQSQKNLIFEEFFRFQLSVSVSKEKNQSFSIASKEEKIQQFDELLPFEWTLDQKKVFSEIKSDLKESTSMRRLIQGDVGCGKTIVALKACCYVIESGFQAAFMVPTEVLAEQHFSYAKKWLSPLKINIQLLTAKTKNKKKILNQIQTGECRLCIGTQALIQDQVQFHNLGLTVIDEQHRFGVNQRFQLLNKGKSPHCLMMTATPIPRTLSMTLYSDLDISTIRTKPKGRLPIVTKKTNRRLEVFSFLEKEVAKGRQGYVVYPLVKESEKIDLKNASLQFEKLKKSFPKIQWGLLHGQLTTSEKSQVIQDFICNKIQVLVSTTVIEVGVDVSNATIMIIENAERFGLSQLHQLRGRVGRGSLKSYCILTLGSRVSREALMRAKVMEDTEDGFLIAEQDLKLRGAGHLIGTKQSGHLQSQFRIANPYRDIELLKKSQLATQKILKEDPQLNQYPKLKQVLFQLKL